MADGQIHPELMRRFAALSAAARAAGTSIGIGSGYRTVEEQIQLRISNGCPDIWSSPASSCNIPTAIPGRSNHNHGLAIDITGDTGWANANAARFGLHFPVPGEDWHLELIDDEAAQGAVGEMSGGFAEPIGFNLEWMEERQNPEDELGRRVDSIMNIVVGNPDEIPDIVETPELGVDTTTIQPPGQPAMATQVGTPASGDRLGNARLIAQVGRQLGAPDEAIKIALAAALVESDLVNVNYGDRDSLGLFQQRPSQGWGTPEQVMNPEYAATQFFNGLLGMNWQSMDPGAAAQAVQRSAFPERYGERYPEAVSIFNQIGGI